jgi:hypothetical protein
MVSAIHEFKGKQDLFVSGKSNVLTAMHEIAKVQITGASNKIQGIVTTDEREIAGYVEVLSLINESYDMMSPRPNILLQIHNLIYQFSQSSIGGKFKNSNNIIKEIDTNGIEKIRFKPLSSFETPFAIERLTSEFIDAIKKAI